MAIKRTNQGPVIKSNCLGRIGVLMGGPSSERKISLKSGHAVLGALKKRALQTVAIDIKTDNAQENASLIRYHKIDCAFIALHGRFGEDGAIQRILEKLKIPYTGSGVKASRLAMDKVASRRIFVASGLNVPAYKTLSKASYNHGNCRVGFIFGRPVVIKPVTHGSSIGLSIIAPGENLKKAIELGFRYDERIIIEEYIEGREMTVGILDEEALPVIEIIPKKLFFDFEAKYRPGMTDYVVPAKLDRVISAGLRKAALRAHRLLGCFGFSRVDMILSNDNRPYVLEINSIPGLTAHSLLPKAAKSNGIEFDDLCIKLIKLAYEKAQA
jgi:D-alanine-D-alanine ligase